MAKGINGNRFRPATARQLQKDFGRRLRILRLAWGEFEPGKHSQEAWAKALGVEHSAISRWENGLFPMPEPLVYRIVFGFSVTWDFLYGGLIGPGMDPELAKYLEREYPGTFEQQAQWGAELAAKRARFRVQSSVHRRRRARRKPRPGAD